MRPKTFPKALAAFFLFSLLGLSSLSAATIKMRVVVVNPSESKTQTKSIKNYLPKEVTMKDIKDAGELEIEYDESQGMFYAFKNDIQLAPGETKTFELVMDDVFTVHEDALKQVRGRTDNLMAQFKGKPYFDQADAIAKTIYSRLDDISKTQNDNAVNRQQHIAYFRDNLKTLEAIRADLEKLEKLVAKVGGAPDLDVIEKSDVNLKSPTTKTTWIVIFTILVFIGILAAAFYFTWQGQARVTENIFTKEKDASFAEFKNAASKESPPIPPEETKKT